MAKKISRLEDLTPDSNNFNKHTEFGNTQFVVEVVCKDEADQNEVFSKLDAQGYEVRFKTK